MCAPKMKITEGIFRGTGVYVLFWSGLLMEIVACANVIHPSGNDNASFNREYGLLAAVLPCSLLLLLVLARKGGDIVIILYEDRLERLFLYRVKTIYLPDIYAV